MKLMNATAGYIALILAVLTGLVGLSYATNESLQVEITICMDKSEYLLDEPIWVEVLIMNTSDETASLPPPVSGVGLFRFILRGTDGDTIPRTPPIVVGCPQRGPDALVSPRDTLYSLRNLLETFGDHVPWLSSVNTLPTGSYTLEAEYDGMYTSNLLSFSVVEPHGEESHAHDLLMTGRDLKWKKRYDQAIQRFETVVESYPTSVYAARALIYMRGIYMFAQPDSDRVLGIATALLLNHTTSGYVTGGLNTYIERYGESARPLIDSLKAATNSMRFRMLAKRSGF